MEEKAKLQKPRVLGTVGILILRGVLLGFLAFTLRQAIGDPAYVVADWAQAYLVMIVMMAVACVIAGVLIFTYQRIGLYLGMAVSVADLVIGGLLIITGNFSGSPLGIIVTLAIMYYMWKYLTQEPDCEFFT
jgi:hypothetical protein